jgi:predicted amidohydrolase
VFKESSVLSPGSSPTIIKTPWGNVGMGICFDLRFNELSNYYKQNNCKMIFYPGNFTEWSGKKHWKLLLQSRALDTQCFIIGCSTALNNNMEYRSYGHSQIVNPWGEVLCEFSNEPKSTIVEIDLSIVEEVKRRIPINNILSL